LKNYVQKGLEKFKKKIYLTTQHKIEYMRAAGAGVAKVVKYLPHRHEALSSKPRIATTTKDSQKKTT
jgi:hypothetical protein